MSVSLAFSQYLSPLRHLFPVASVAGTSAFYLRLFSLKPKCILYTFRPATRIDRILQEFAMIECSSMTSQQQCYCAVRQMTQYDLETHITRSTRNLSMAIHWKMMIQWIFFELR